MKTSEIRRRFLDYFAARGHEVVPSSALVPGNDPTLLFTNSGMVQFKEVFLGEAARAHPRAVTAQRCVRAGGKHNDLENVGYTARHHTFFEMLGNFSFGDYFKAEAIEYAWELLTREFGLPADKLWVTVFEEDDEAERIWLRDIGVDKSRFSRIGASDNFWSMGDTGPCGPCSEIFYDHGPEVAGGPPGTPEAEGDRFVEIWNLVFMQFNRNAAGAMQPLPQPSVDTGMGLERIAAVLQGVHSNYDIDLFRRLMAAAAAALQVDARAPSQQSQHSLQVIADHIRSAAFLITDGVIPSNEGRGYVLRRIIRRAIRHGYQLGRRESFMHKLVRPLVDEMGDASPELASAAALVEQTLRRENDKFAETLGQGIKILDSAIDAIGAGAEIAGETAFKLYDTYGFPLDLTADIAREHNLTVDTAAFDACMAAQRSRARAASRFGGGGGGGDVGGRESKVAALDGIGETEFTGYDELQSAVKALALLDEARQAVGELRAGESGVVVADRTPFYAESGGQVGDRGTIKFPGAVFAVDDTQYAAGRTVAHLGRVTAGRLRAGDLGQAQVDAESRRGCAANHSATHLLHAALKAALGAHVQQKGSLVEAQRLRFDFSHPAPLDQAQLDAIEQQVNRAIRANALTEAAVMDLDAAKAGGAEALFGEKYDARVRTIRMGKSFELCGGTHVARSGDIGLFKIISESGVAAGVRRIEALCGAHAERWVAAQLALLDAAAAAVKSTPRELHLRLQTMLDERRALQQRIDALQAQLVSGGGDAARVEDINGVQLVAMRADDADAKTMRMTVDQWKQKLGSGIVLVTGVSGGKVTLVAGVTADLAGKYHAGRLIAGAAQAVDGRGGGKAEFAQGGGARVEAVAQAAEEFCRAVAAVGGGGGAGGAVKSAVKTTVKSAAKSKAKSAVKSKAKSAVKTTVKPAAKSTAQSKAKSAAKTKAKAKTKT
ncbi:MAG: alanine--tRNA ligase [Gammaproteobacteria bacterium]|nr:alanine--tRNA ligase [Gammaproteobacteria bacterium]